MTLKQRKQILNNEIRFSYNRLHKLIEEAATNKDNELVIHLAQKLKDEEYFFRAPPEQRTIKMFVPKIPDEEKERLLHGKWQNNEKN